MLVISESFYPKGFDESAPNKQKLVKEAPEVVNWNTRCDNMHGVGSPPQSGPTMRCTLGGYVHHLDGQSVDHNTVAIASMIAVTVENVAMAKLTFMHATQACYKHQVIDWSSLGPKTATYAGKILGGTWTAGISGWCYQHLNTAECYVCMIESKALWMSRNTGGASVSLNTCGFVPAK